MEFAEGRRPNAARADAGADLGGGAQHDLDPDSRAATLAERGGELGRRRRVVLLAADGVHQEAAARRAALPQPRLLRTSALGTLRPQQVRQQLQSTPFIDLGGALDSATTPVIWDFVHTNEEGARLAAAAVYANLLPQLRARAARWRASEDPRDQRLLPRLRGRAGASTASSSPPRRRSASPARSTTPRSPSTRSRTACARGDVGSEGVDAVVYYDKPITTFVRLLKTYLRVGPKGIRSFSSAMPTWTREKLWIPYEIERGLKRIGTTMPKDLWFTEHHESHAASAVLPVAVRERGDPHLRRRGRVGHEQRRRRPGQPHRAAAPAQLPALARPPLLGVHLLLRLPGELGRVQAHGPRPVRQARLRRRDPRAPARPAAGRLVPHGDEVLQLPLRASR